MVLDGSALDREYRRVRFQQVLALHAGAARPRAHEQRVVAVVERDIRVVRCNHAGQGGERAVVEFHDDAVQGVQRRRYLEQLQDDGLIGAEHLARCDPKRKLIADLAGRTGDRDTSG